MLDSLTVLADSVTDTAAQTTAGASNLLATIFVCCLYTAILALLVRAIVKNLRRTEPIRSKGKRVRRLLWVLVAILSGVGVRLYCEFGAYGKYDLWILSTVIGVLSLCMAARIFIKVIVNPRNYAWNTVKVLFKTVIIETLWVSIVMLAACWITSEFFVDTALEAKQWADRTLDLNDYVTTIIRDLMGLAFIALKVVNAIKK